MSNWYHFESQECMTCYHFESQECMNCYHLELWECMNRYHFMYENWWVYGLGDVCGDSLYVIYEAQDDRQNQKMVFICKLPELKLLKELILKKKKLGFYFSYIFLIMG